MRLEMTSGGSGVGRLMGRELESAVYGQLVGGARTSKLVARMGAAAAAA